MAATTARLLNNGGSQAVRLSAELRFEGEKVLVRRDERTGDAILVTSNVKHFTMVKRFGR